MVLPAFIAQHSRFGFEAWGERYRAWVWFARDARNRAPPPPPTGSLRALLMFRELRLHVFGIGGLGYGDQSPRGRRVSHTPETLQLLHKEADASSKSLRTFRRARFGTNAALKSGSHFKSGGLAKSGHPSARSGGEEREGESERERERERESGRERERGGEGSKFLKEQKRGSPSHPQRVTTTVHTVEYEPLIKSQLASRN